MADYCIGAVGPNYARYQGGVTGWVENADEALRNAYLASMELGRANNLPTIAFSLLSAGAARGKGRTAGGLYLSRTLNEVLAIAVQAIQDGAYNGLKEVHLVAFQDQEVKATVEVVHSVIDDPIYQEQRETVKHALRCTM